MPAERGDENENGAEGEGNRNTDDEENAEENQAGEDQQFSRPPPKEGSRLGPVLRAIQDPGRVAA